MTLHTLRYPIDSNVEINSKILLLKLNCLFSVLHNHSSSPSSVQYKTIVGNRHKLVAVVWFALVHNLSPIPISQLKRISLNSHLK